MKKINNNKKIVLFVILFLIGILIGVLFKDKLISVSQYILKSFNRTVIEEDRYILLLKGLKSTLIVSLTSILLGTLLGFILYYIRRKKIIILSNIIARYVSLIQGIPITVLLLTFYYVIFGNIDISPTIVAIITFSLYFSAYASEIFRGAIDSIKISQIQSSYSLGFTKMQTLKYIILPQALTYTIPVYKNEIVSLIKLTSISGYISVMDLTKASDIIRNRTYEAFFPLIFTALIYFLICFVISKSLDCLYKKTNPRKFNVKMNGNRGD